MKLKRIEADVLAALRTYDDAGVIDKRTLRSNLEQEATKFGNDVMEYRYELVDVKDYFADLPKGFWKLVSAIRYRTIKEDKESLDNITLRQQYTYKQLEERTYEFDETDYQHYLGNYKQITELVPVHHTMYIYKHTPSEILKETKRLSSDFANNGNKDIANLNSGFQNCIKITNRTLQATFKEGKILLCFKGLPRDEDGDIEVPDIPQLTDYLKFNAIYGVLDDIFLQDEFPNLPNQLSYYQNKVMNARTVAQTAVKMSMMKEGWEKRVQLNNKKRWRT